MKRFGMGVGSGKNGGKAFLEYPLRSFYEREQELGSTYIAGGSQGAHYFIIIIFRMGEI